jgi:hypothetical protein
MGVRCCWQLLRSESQEGVAVPSACGGSSSLPAEVTMPTVADPTSAGFEWHVVRFRVANALDEVAYRRLCTMAPGALSLQKCPQPRRAHLHRVDNECSTDVHNCSSEASSVPRSLCMVCGCALQKMYVHVMPSESIAGGGARSVPPSAVSRWCPSVDSHTGHLVMPSEIGLWIEVRLATSCPSPRSMLLSL